jgi:hypothetical protein
MFKYTKSKAHQKRQRQQHQRRAVTYELLVDPGIPDPADCIGVFELSRWR